MKQRRLLAQGADDPARVHARLARRDAVGVRRQGARPVLELVEARTRQHPGADRVRRRREGRRRLRRLRRARRSWRTSPTRARSTCSRAPATSARRSSRRPTRYFVEKRPAIEFIHFSDPDDLGHSDGWMSNPQLEAIRQTDKCLATLLDARSKRRASIARRCSSSRRITAGTATTTRERSKRTASSPGSPGAPASAPVTASKSHDQHRRHRRDRPLGPRLPPRPGALGKPVLEAFEPESRRTRVSAARLSPRGLLAARTDGFGRAKLRPGGAHGADPLRVLEEVDDEVDQGPVVPGLCRRRCSCSARR